MHTSSWCKVTFTPGQHYNTDLPANKGDRPGNSIDLRVPDLRRESAGHTLQATALVHEASLRLVDQHSVTWQSCAHFFSVAAQMMRRILVDHARSRRYAKRGGAAQKLSLDEAFSFAEERCDAALVRLQGSRWMRCAHSRIQANGQADSNSATASRGFASVTTSGARMTRSTTLVPSSASMNTPALRPQAG
ncbi:MAG: hypothetical protein HY314_13235 [Acidobacteria bacterium]|nr:hypothetical protein [Acidobacteriota bacterium]